ncbi:MAG: MFS transporter [Litoreibacter sp.]
MSHSIDSRTKKNVAVLVIAQAVLGAQLPMMFVVAGLAGNMLTPNPCLATLPISMIVFGSMTTAPWLSPLMQRRGRRFGFIVGALCGALGAAIALSGLWFSSFPIFLLGSYISGIYMSAQGFYRFAAADSASDAFRPKAISYVMAGGLLSAVIGPQMNKVLMDLSVVPFVGTYVFIIATNLFGLFLFFALDLPKTATAAEIGGAVKRTRAQLLRTPVIVVAIICGMVSYSLMNLVMTSTPLAVVGCGFDLNDANDVVSFHVLAMYIPSFFTGHLIAKFGVRTIIAAGLLILAAAGIVGLHDVQLGNFYVALVLLGIGWNFGFIGATTMLAQSHSAHERGTVQGLNDMLVFGCVTVASLASGGLMNCSGGSPIEGWTAVNLAMVPFLMLAGGALLWLAFRPKTLTA